MANENPPVPKPDENDPPTPSPTRRIARQPDPEPDDDILGEIAEQKKRIRRLERQIASEPDSTGNRSFADWLPSIAAALIFLGVIGYAVVTRFRNRDDSEESGS